ncbi:MAG: AAA family ATPase, partial [Lachnospiraceae bacterium]|nr:AAA family ATPase [Lachnospiraceae bacterium]
MKKFNTTAVCIPSKHYMVDLSDRVREIKKMVDEGEYFTINRARQYGKTTTLNELRKVLEKEYNVLDLSFEGISHAGFKDEQSFVKAFCRLLKRRYRTGLRLPQRVKESFEDFLSRREEKAQMDELFDVLTEWCEESEKKVVLLIDEVDSATNNQVFLDFLAGLRDGYIDRSMYGGTAFQSVILAGVTDVKHLKSKIRNEADAKQNSPWNIAADFMVDMSLSEDGIRGMLDEYEADHQTGMDIPSIAKQIRGYTNGYPFLVSRICQIIDQRMLPESFANLAESWTEYGVDEAVRLLLSEDNTLFASLMGKLHNMPTLRSQLRKILMSGEVVIWQTYDKEQEQLRMYGFIRNNKGTVAVENRIFEMLLYHHFIGE